jgi:hypothetical protein
VLCVTSVCLCSVVRLHCFMCSHWFVNACMSMRCLVCVARALALCDAATGVRCMCSCLFGLVCRCFIVLVVFMHVLTRVCGFYCIVEFDPVLIRSFLRSHLFLTVVMRSLVFAFGLQWSHEILAV